MFEQKQLADLAAMIVLTGGLADVFYLYRREVAERIERFAGDFRGG